MGQCSGRDDRSPNKGSTLEIMFPKVIAEIIMSYDYKLRNLREAILFYQEYVNDIPLIDYRWNYALFIKGRIIHLLDHIYEFHDINENDILKLINKTKIWLFEWRYDTIGNFHHNNLIIIALHRKLKS